MTNTMKKKKRRVFKQFKVAVMDMYALRESRGKWFLAFGTSGQGRVIKKGPMTQANAKRELRKLIKLFGDASTGDTHKERHKPANAAEELLWLATLIEKKYKTED